MSIYSRALIGARSGVPVVGGGGSGSPGPAMTMSGDAAYGASGSGFGQALVAGSGSLPNLIPSSGPWTIECRLLNGGGRNPSMALASDGCFWMGTYASGSSVGSVGGGGNDLYFTGPDGGEVASDMGHLALSYDGTGTFRLLAGGAVRATSARTFASTTPNLSSPIIVRTTGSYAWEGGVDEVRISNVDRYGAGGYAVPSAPLVRDANTLGLYHFDGNGSAA